MSLLEYISDKGLINKEDILGATEEAKNKGKDLEEVLIEKGLSTNDLLVAKSEFFSLPSMDMSVQKVPFEVLKYIPEESALHYKIIPIGVKDGVLQVGIVDPDNMQARDALQFISGKSGLPFKIFVINKGDFDDIVKNYKGLTGEVTKALSELEQEIKEQETEKKETKKESKVKDKEKLVAQIVEEAPVTKIVAVALRHATEGGASDVHIEHTGDKLRVRFRVDGVLYTSIFLPPTVHPAVVARIKILAKLKLDEKRKPQDGRFSATIEGRKIDFRVSTFPAYYGEKVVMRILDPEKGRMSLSLLGLSDKHIETVKRALDRPYGLILLTGPTGSGKTSTLYSMMEQIDREKVNVVSLEDPIEYNMMGVNQSQIRPEIGYTFANGLRSILRQDPDVIMVGEIRDKETAQLAIQAALTGHLVFSTLHTNNSIGVIPRLIDMGVDPYLIAPTLVLAIAQRLVRKICPSAKKPIQVEGSIKALVDEQFKNLPDEYRNEILGKANTVYDIAPAPDCPGGTRGRIAAFEILEINKEIEEIILKNPTEPEIWKAARRNGMLTMKEDALLKAFDGTIPFEEVHKV